MYSDDDLLPLSGLQHMAFCERQWALIHVEGLWEESSDTLRADSSMSELTPPVTRAERGSAQSAT